MLSSLLQFGSAIFVYIEALLLYTAHAKGIYLIFPTPLGYLTRRARSKNAGVVNVPRSTITNRTSMIGMIEHV